MVTPPAQFASFVVPEELPYSVSHPTFEFVGFAPQSTGVVVFTAMLRPDGFLAQVGDAVDDSLEPAVVAKSSSMVSIWFSPGPRNGPALVVPTATYRVQLELSRFDLMAQVFHLFHELVDLLLLAGLPGFVERAVDLFELALKLADLGAKVSGVLVALGSVVS